MACIIGLPWRFILAPGRMQTHGLTRNGGETDLFQRMIGAAMLRRQTFEEVEHDSAATIQAGMVVVIVAIATGIGSLGSGVEGAPNGVGVFIGGVIVSLVGWAVWAWITYFIGTRLLRDQDTHADWGQLARTLGFAQSPGIFKVLGVIPGVGLTIFIIAVIWQLVAMVIAIQQALDYTSTWRAVGVALVGFIPYIIFQTLVVTLVLAVLGSGQAPPA